MTPQALQELVMSLDDAQTADTVGAALAVELNLVPDTSGFFATGSGLKTPTGLARLVVEFLANVLPRT